MFDKDVKEEELVMPAVFPKSLWRTVSYSNKGCAQSSCSSTQSPRALPEQYISNSPFVATKVGVNEMQ